MKDITTLYKKPRGWNVQNNCFWLDDINVHFRNRGGWRYCENYNDITSWNEKVKVFDKYNLDRYNKNLAPYDTTIRNIANECNINIFTCPLKDLEKLHKVVPKTINGYKLKKDQYNNLIETAKEIRRIYDEELYKIPQDIKNIVDQFKSIYLRGKHYGAYFVRTIDNSVFYEYSISENNDLILLEFFNIYDYSDTFVITSLDNSPEVYENKHNSITRKSDKILYEQIMRNISREVKRALNEADQSKAKRVDFTDFIVQIFEIKNIEKTSNEHLEAIFGRRAYIENMTKKAYGDGVYPEIYADEFVSDYWPKIKNGLFMVEEVQPKDSRWKRSFKVSTQDGKDLMIVNLIK